MKKVYLLDTNIVSEFSKQNPNPQVVEFYNARRNLCAISAITWQELTRGVSRLPEGKRKNTLSSFIKNFEVNTEVISYDKFASQICGEIQAAAEKNGHTLPFYDSQIAATAISNGMILVTRNTADFAPIREKSFLRVEDWFTS